jgi:transposase
LHWPGSIEIVLELSYLIDGPILRQLGEGIRDRAGVVVVERRLLAPERDIDRQRDLLDRREAVESMRARVARQIEKFVGTEIRRRHAVWRLLVGGIGRVRRAAVLADQLFVRSNFAKTISLALARAASTSGIRSSGMEVHPIAEA